MYLRVPKFLNDQNLKLVDELIAGGQFTDGAATTGGPTKSVKKNLQIDLVQHPQRDQFLQMITTTANSNSMMRSATLPRRMTLPLLSKYATGMAYGWHIDNPIMTAMGSPVRTDIACTVFISDSSDYQGGELVVRTSSGDVRVKLDRGDAFIYPATSRHQVLEVTSGERLAVVFWIQSMVADASKREILRDLSIAYDRVLKDSPESEALQSIQRSQANLLRRWGQV
ncbi:MAG: Fe2+-dependent dioxygenase [SAR86 cluster bacterium]|uniref:Fe2+-dependent dioxygenase n=1 Tax=SAR86 cluster bacterium TaxID=2030880 RepID=A0A2A4XBM5_9GAMM|nr:MAG: Fe2+-dependent dioxygenase [SAR86 cluster bacterium]